MTSPGRRLFELGATVDGPVVDVGESIRTATSTTPAILGVVGTIEDTRFQAVPHSSARPGR